MRVVVFGLWHLGCVTAACVAAAGKQVVGLELDGTRLERLERGEPPIAEPGLPELIAAGRAAGKLSFTSNAARALAGASVLWVTFDTPVNERDEADVGAVRSQLEAIRGAIEPGTLVIVSSQVPVGFTRALAGELGPAGAHCAYSPENLRLGRALSVFREPERVIVGLMDERDRGRVEELFAPYAKHIEWMSVESAEMTKHAINAFLATSVSFINELARLCERVGADAREVERGLKTEGRIGPRAYLSPGPAFAGGTLARDLRFLSGFGSALGVETPLFDGVMRSNESQKGWLQRRVSELIDGRRAPVVAVLGLTYKPGTDTLRRSTAVELCKWLQQQGARVQAHDPVIARDSAELAGIAHLSATPGEALAGADLAVVATEWPEFKRLTAHDFTSAMRNPIVIDLAWFLAAALDRAPGLQYVALGRGTTTADRKTEA